jgi:hypothetical protein
MPYASSSGASPSRAAARRSRGRAEFRAAEREERRRRILRRLPSGQQATCLICAFKAASCRSCRGSVNGKLFRHP